MNRVPSHAPAAPAASTAAMPAPVTMPPAASTGTPRRPATSSSSCSSGSVPTAPAWPPASVPCATIASTPAVIARSADGTSETWATTRAPAACACSVHPAGSPKDSDTTAGRSASDAPSSSGRRSSIHTIRPIPNRPCGRASAACSAIHSVRGALLVTPIRPSPPAADTAPASLPPDHPPIGASTIG